MINLMAEQANPDTSMMVVAIVAISCIAIVAAVFFSNVVIRNTAKYYNKWFGKK